MIETKRPGKGGVKIHSTALVSKKARIGGSVEIGPYTVIGDNVRIGDRTKIMSHALIDGHTTIGAACEIFHGACLGLKSQDKKFREKGETYLVIGDENVIREYVTMHPATSLGKKTTVGDRNFIMIGAHIGHDCVIGNDIVMANGCALSGHVVVEDQAVLGGLSGVHQFCRVGRLAMVGAMTKVVMDVPPFSVCDGHPAKFCGLNSIGLKRAGYSSKSMLEIKKALKILLASGFKLSSAIARVKSEWKNNPDIEALIHFCAASSRGLCRGSLIKDSEGTDVAE